jgi:hypothetical protein
MSAAAPLVVKPGQVACKLCRKVFLPPVALRVIPGAGDQTRLINFVQDLDTHLAKEHPEEYGLCEIQAMQFQGLAKLTNFMIADGEVRDQNEFLRWSIHQLTLNVRYSDDDLTVISERLSALVAADFNNPALEKPAADAAAKIRAVLLEMRTQLEEPGRYVVKPAVDTPH